MGEDSANDMSIYSQKKRKALIRKEFERLYACFDGLENRRQESIGKLVTEAAFMSVTLAETREIITRDGPIDRYQNGANQWGTKRSAAVESYDKMVITYAKVMTQLIAVFPDGPDAGKELMDWVNNFRPDAQPRSNAI
jgi:hypothetical protein